MAYVKAAGMGSGGDQLVQVVGRVAFQIFQGQEFRSGQMGRYLLQAAEDAFRFTLRKVGAHVRAGNMVRNHVHDPRVGFQFPCQVNGADDVFRIAAA